MPLEPQCVVCARPLRIPRRADRRYCGSSCRVRAFRVRKQRQLPPTTAMRDPRRAPRENARSLVDSTRVQLAMFRDLRQARKHAVELTAQLTQAKKASEEQRREHDQERRVLQESLAAARQQSALLETALSEVKTLGAAQMKADAETAERLTAEHRRAAERIDELGKAACIADAAHRKTVEQLQDALDAAQRQLATVDAARLAAEMRNQALDAVSEELEAEKKRNARLLDKLGELWTSTQAERAEHERKLKAEQQQTATEQQQTSALRASLREAMTTVRQQRDQLDDTVLALSEARAGRDPLVYAAKMEKLEAALSAAQKELASRTAEGDLMRESVKALLVLRQEQRQQLASVEQDLSNKKALLAEQQVLIAKVQAKTDEAYTRLLLIKEKRDWRL